MKTYKLILLLTAITLLAMSPVVSYAQYTMLVHKTDGNVLRLSLADVDSVTFDYSSDQTVIHEYVDLGLSVMWATCNVGTSSPLMTGDYYAWGEKETHYVGDFQSGGVEWKEGKTGYNWTSYYYRIAESEWNTVTVSKYNSDASRGNVDNKTTLDMGDDVAYVKWGGDWRMPSYEEFEELINSCTWIRSNHNGIDGYTVRSNLNGDSIFFPYSGEFIWDINVPNNATEVMCWTRTVGKAGTGHAYYMTTDNGKASMAYNQRCFGLTVRPVFVSDKYDSTKVAYIELGNAELQLNTGASERISCYTYSSLGNSLTADVNWSSTDPSVATVSNDGTVTAVKAGTCKVVASIGSISRMCDVIVTTQVSPISASGSNNGYGYVDLGLSVKWAICNIGADNPEDYGDYFAWGETEPYYADGYSQSNNPVWKDGKSNGYSWSSYKYANGSSGALTKYCTDSSKGYNGFVDNKTVLDLEDDAAHVNWGGNWRMPTQEEMEELRGKCSWSWTTLNGVVGYLVTSRVAGYENSSIFFPAAGSRSGTYLSDVGTKGKYWSNTFGRYYSDESIYGCNFEMSSGFSYSHSNYGTIRYYGMSIRPVCVKRLEQLYDLTLSESSLQLHVGGTRELLADTSGIGSVELVWSSTNDSVATVRNGVVTAISAGTCEITLTAGVHQGICDVTVYENTDHEYVDLGLSVLWATYNVGASTPEEFGDYFAWGETEPKTLYYDYNYKYKDASSLKYTKYCFDYQFGHNGYIDNKTILDLEDDAANANWGGDWRLPTQDEITELIAGCRWTIMDSLGVRGYRGISINNGNIIFIPMAGDKWYDHEAGGIGLYAIYLSSSLSMSYGCGAGHFYGHERDNVLAFSTGSRYSGSPARPVRPLESLQTPPDDEIWYFSTDNSIVTPYMNDAFGTSIVSNTYSDGKGVIKFNAPVTQVGASAFMGCSTLRAVSLPGSVKSIGNNAFINTNLSSISLPDGLERLEMYSVTSTKCNQLFIPKSVNYIHPRAIGPVRSIMVDQNNSTYDSRNNCNAVIETATNTLIKGCCNTVIPADVTAIGSYAMSYCNLISYVIPEGIVSIGASAFVGNYDLKELSIPGSLESIGDMAFESCWGLKKITIPAGVTSIGAGILSYCAWLDSVIVVPGNSVYDSREKCNAIIETATNKLVAGCNNTFIPLSVTVIGEEAFSYCNQMDSLNIPAGVKSIEYGAFRGCSKIKTFVIPESVESIDAYAFNGCSKLDSVVVQRTVPPTLEANAFGYTNDCPIYVPAESLQAYKEAPNWSTYESRIQPIP